MPKKSLKSKRGTSKKSGKGSKRTRKMKGGVSYNPVFSTTLLPKGTYYELNNYNDDPLRPPEVIDSRLLPAMKGGKKKNTRKRRGGMTSLKRYRRAHEYFRGRKSEGEQKEIDDAAAAAAEDARKKEINDRKKDMKENYVKLDGQILYDEFDKINEDHLLKKAVFYKFDDYYNKIELGKLTGTGPTKERLVDVGRFEYSYNNYDYILIFGEKYEVGYTKKIYQDDPTKPIIQTVTFYVHKDDLKNPKYNEDKSQQPGGKKRRKSRKKRKMKGGSLVGTDLITGLNTTNTNSVIAFGTTGGTEYMYNTLAGKSIDSGPYMSPETPVEPVLA